MRIVIKHLIKNIKNYLLLFIVLLTNNIWQKNFCMQDPIFCTKNCCLKKEKRVTSENFILKNLEKKLADNLKNQKQITCDDIIEICKISGPNKSDIDSIDCQKIYKNHTDSQNLKDLENLENKKNFDANNNQNLETNYYNDYYKETPLNIACYLGNISIVKLLITKYKFNPNQKGTDGATPIILIALQSIIWPEILEYAQIFNFLLENGANPEIDDDFNNTPIKILCKNNGNLEQLINQLLEIEKNNLLKDLENSEIKLSSSELRTKF